MKRPSSTLKEQIVDHQIGLAFTLLSALVAIHLCFPQWRSYSQKFWQLSYHDPASDQYNTGTDDLYLVIFWIVMLTGLRATVMSYIFIPIARWGGVHKPKARMRFAEQAWLCLHHATSFAVGMYIFTQSDYWLNFREMWTAWPDRKMDALLKRYYLIEFAFWLQQILTVNIEKRRKDYHQMLTHHIITCALISASYLHHLTRVGNVILCLMDIVDVVFSGAKLLKYLHFQMACDVAFAVFMVSWVVARHVLYMMVVFSVYGDTQDAMHFACYDQNGIQADLSPEAANSFFQVIQPFLDPQGVACWSPKVKWTFLTMLLALQGITIVWFGMILRVAWRIINGGTAEDSRSDDEVEAEAEEEEEEEALALDMDPEGLASLQHHHSPHQHRNQHFLPQPTTVHPRPFEQEVGVEAIDFRTKTARPSKAARGYRKVSSSSTSVTLPGHHSDRKELLGRIGCDKTT
ncbi:MAG: hypothetical protein M1823_005660 [Watsoniomyces obsoletus]|nr:MAG: hypothetical protein M1823_005660 [Watsoniomyces obsoletus]